METWLNSSSLIPYISMAREGVAAADDGEAVRRRDGLQRADGPYGEAFVLEQAQRALDEDGLGIPDDRRVRHHGL